MDRLSSPRTAVTGGMNSLLPASGPAWEITRFLARVKGLCLRVDRAADSDTKARLALSTLMLRVVDTDTAVLTLAPLCRSFLSQGTPVGVVRGHGILLDEHPSQAGGPTV